MEIFKKAYGMVTSPKANQSTKRNYTSEYKIPSSNIEISRLIQEAKLENYKNALFFMRKTTDEYLRLSIDDILGAKILNNNHKNKNDFERYLNDFERYPILLNLIIIDQLLPTVEVEFNYNKSSKRSPTLNEIIFMRENAPIANIFYKCHKLVLHKFGIYYNLDFTNFYINIVALENIYSDLTNNLNVFTKLLICMYNFQIQDSIPILINLLYHHIIKPYGDNPTIEKYKILWIHIINIKNNNWQNIYKESELIFYPSLDLYNEYIKLDPPLVGKHIDFVV